MRHASTSLQNRGRLAFGLSLAPLLLLLAGCATMSESECRAADWAEVGYRDGVAGRPETHLAQHVEACADAGIRPDARAWRAGREQGLAVYCTPDNAYEAGRRGEPLREVCLRGDRRELERANARGLRYHETSQEIASLEAERDRLERRIDRLLDRDPTPDGQARIREMREEVRRLDRRIRRLEDERRTYRRPA